MTAWLPKSKLNFFLSSVIHEFGSQRRSGEERGEGGRKARVREGREGREGDGGSEGGIGGRERMRRIKMKRF